MTDRELVILLTDGSWTTMEIPPGKPKVNSVMARTISDRAQHPPGS